LLAKDLRAHGGVRQTALSLTSIASRLAPTGGAHQKPPNHRTTEPPNHQITKPQGRALARLALLILLLLLLLIHPPLRKAEWRHSSGEWARSAVRRSRTHREEVQRSKPEAMSPEGCRSEGTPSPSEGPDARGEPFWLLFWRLKKVTRCKSGTISRRYRRNGYVHKQEHGRQTNRHRWQASAHKNRAHLQESG